MKTFKLILKTWLPFAVAVTAFCLLAYASVQQAYRQGADDPQIQMAEDGANTLNNGASMGDVVPTQQIDISQSLAPFYVIFNNVQEPIASSGVFNGEMPRLPDGVLDYAKENHGNALTWEPEPGTRIATIIIPYNEGFVLAGRSMREVEARESQLSIFVGAAWILALLATFIVIAFGEFLFTEK
jgi:hypothetical protein